MERKQKRIFGIKGMGGAGIPLINKISVNNVEKVRIFMLGVDSGKEILMTRLKTVDEGPGYCHFPINADRGYNETYIKGLTSEQRVIHFKEGRPVLKWVKKSGTRNEPLDLRNYSTAAAEILKPDFEVLELKIKSGINYMKKSTQVMKKKKNGVANRGIQI
jgi:phage terminase large subunit GpA-like protein